MRKEISRRTYLRITGAAAVGTLTGIPTLRASNVMPGEIKVDFGHGTWIGGPIDSGSSEEWKAMFAHLRKTGIDAVFLQLEHDAYADVIPIANEEGIEIHAWIPTMMQSGMVENHPEWYVVNRKGESAADRPAYVDYYHFLCPSRPPVVEHLRNQVDRLSRIDGLKSVHLDYIRYPDVILPIALWEKYGIVQDREYAEYDYCYCDICRETFRSQHGMDPLMIEDPSGHEEWLQYRYDSITNVVNLLADTVHANDMALTAAVFPTPDIARRLVRQEWTRWNLDGVMPMIYHSFYEEPVEWIQDAAREGVSVLEGRYPLYAGVFVHAMTPDELAESVRLAQRGGAEGVVIFDGKTPTDQHWDRFAKAVRSAD